MHDCTKNWLSDVALIKLKHSLLSRPKFIISNTDFTVYGATVASVLPEATASLIPTSQSLSQACGDYGDSPLLEDWSHFRLNGTRET